MITTKLLRNLFPLLLTFLMISCSAEDSTTDDDNSTDDDTEEEGSDGTTDTPTEEEESTFISVWELTSTNKSIMLPIYNDNGSTEYDFSVDWGDGIVQEVTDFADAERTHTYTDAGEVTVTITGTITGFNFSKIPESRELLKEITTWGDLHFGYHSAVFLECKNLTELPSGKGPNLTGITDLSQYFEFCESLNGGLENWDVSNITNFESIFLKAYTFNNDISSWDVSSAQNFESTFANATDFDQDISSWNVSNGTNFTAMFSIASSFNQDLAAWDVSSAVNMKGMFQVADSFNKDISGWDVSNVTDMSFMFHSNTAFNQDLSNWPTNNVDSCVIFVNGSALINAYIPTLGPCFSTTSF